MSTSNTVRLHRVLRSTPAKVYRAFTQGEALCRWLPPYGFIGTMHAFEAKVGGRFRMSFTNFGTGASHAFSGEYLELVPNERVRYTDQFDDPNLPGTLTVTVQIKPVIGGVDLQIEQTGIPAAIPVEMCYLGWQESLAQLAQLTEPDIPNG